MPTPMFETLSQARDKDPVNLHTRSGQRSDRYTTMYQGDTPAHDRPDDRHPRKPRDLSDQDPKDIHLAAALTNTPDEEAFPIISRHMILNRPRPPTLMDPEHPISIPTRSDHHHHVDIVSRDTTHPNHQKMTSPPHRVQEENQTRVPHLQLLADTRLLSHRQPPTLPSPSVPTEQMRDPKTAGDDQLPTLAFERN